ncbi:hypothetical protein GCM10009675_00290 [Prauserella alba]|uniref:Uncharacterized protein n=1 Tax=Prauserella alba TaxID=176898 RepID=A0ABN1V236_9PSEU
MNMLTDEMAGMLVSMQGEDPLKAGARPGPHAPDERFLAAPYVGSRRVESARHRWSAAGETAQSPNSWSTTGRTTILDEGVQTRD